ncbi:MAG: hypothetical protein KKB50_04610 [Planctomycetes bacterium]|nr:hypothetical protein [Planctomycetota bacterium]
MTLQPTSNEDEFCIAQESRPLAAEHARIDHVDRTEIFAPDGFRLTIRVVGPDITVYLNDHQQPILAATDSAPDYFRRGRIALFAKRIIATFESPEVTPLPSP